MKKIILLLALASLSYASYAQNTYPWPSSGNVGIGVASASSQLELRNGSGLSVIAPNAKILLSDITAGIYLRMDNSSNLQITNNALYPMVSFMQNGNVGIGTALPKNVLDLGDGTRGRGITWSSNGDYIFNSIYSSYSGAGLVLASGFTGTTSAGDGYVSSYSSPIARPGIRLNPFGDDAGCIQFFAAPTATIAAGAAVTPIEAMRINAGGNVSIGITDPQGYKLAVNGTIHTQEVKVDMTGWSDYVFKPTYKLPSLIEIKNYIGQHQHLPEMPSAIEIEKNGVNLGEMVKLQTKKIEELTLYLIEADKANQSLQGQLDTLKQQLATLLKNQQVTTKK